MGNLVGGSGGELLAVVSTLDPIRVFFPVSETEFPALVKALGLSDFDAPKTEGTLDLILNDGSRHPHKGTLAATQLNVDRRTGTIQIVASFPNPGNTLRPGMYARVRAVVRRIRGGLLIPQRAVLELQGEDQVGVVGTDDRVHFKTVKTGPRMGSLWLIEGGLQAGELVVIDAVDRIRSGDVIRQKQVTIESIYGTGPPRAPTVHPESGDPK
jgi:membrane fusion protein (multidrug efflux system)